MFRTIVFAILLMACMGNRPTVAPFTIVVHGGAGTISKDKLTPKLEKQYKQGLTNALKAGYTILEKGGSAVDAVEAAVVVLEDNPLFNAGKGAVFANDGKNELDASIMDGSNLKAGAVAGVRDIRNPIQAARAVMEKSEHVLLSGPGASAFAKQQGLVIVDPAYFFTESRWEGLQRVKKKDSLATQLDHDEDKNSHKRGTVGAVALDKNGNLAAATSTGGMTNKRYGRVGDSPIIGAGTYASNSTAAISCTGWGEFFIRMVMAKTVCDRMEFGNQSLNDAANTMVIDKLTALGGDGGLIAIDKAGNIAMPFNTSGMYRGYWREKGEAVVEIFK